MTENVFAPPRASLDVQEGPEVLWQMSWKDIRKLYLASVNIRALGFLYGLGAFGVFAVAATTFIGLSQAPAAPAGDFLPAALFSGLLAVMGVLYVSACVTSYTRPKWGRVLGIVLCVLGLISFPFGTLISIFGLVAYAQGGKLFGPDRLPHKDVAAVYKQRKKDKR